MSSPFLLHKLIIYSDSNRVIARANSDNDVPHLAASSKRYLIPRNISISISTSRPKSRKSPRVPPRPAKPQISARTQRNRRGFPQNSLRAFRQLLHSPYLLTFTRLDAAKACYRFVGELL